MKLAKEVRNAMDRISLGEVDQPFSERRLINEIGPPQSTSDRGPGRQFQNSGAGNFDKLASGQRLDRVIHRLQDEYVQIAEVTGHKIRKNMASSIWKQFRPAR